MIGLSINTPSPIKKIAAIDLGTNSISCNCGRNNVRWEFPRIDDLKKMVVLAKEGIGRRLSPRSHEQRTFCFAKSRFSAIAIRLMRFWLMQPALFVKLKMEEYLSSGIDQVGIKFEQFLEVWKPNSLDMQYNTDLV